MARKKKSRKKAAELTGAAESTDALGSDETGSSATPTPAKRKRAPRKEGAAGSKRTDGKETGGRKADNEVAGPDIATDDPTIEITDLDADLDADGDTTEEVARLLAEAVALAGDEASGVADGEATSGALLEVVDLDADDPELDDSADAAAVLDELLADVAGEADQAPDATVAATADAAAALPVIDLDDEGEDDAVAILLADLAGSDNDAGEALVLGDVSSHDARARLIAEALAHVEMQEARYRVSTADPRGVLRWKGLVAGVILLAACLVAVAPPRWIRPTPPAPIDAGERLRGLRAGLLLQAEQIEAFRIREQRLPRTLDEIPARLPGIRFVRSGNRGYQLLAYRPDGGTAIYDSSAPAPPFRTAVRAWAVGEEGP